MKMHALPLRILLVATLMCVAAGVHAQRRPPGLRHLKENSDCRHNGHLSKAKRRQMCPFSEAASVEVISFVGVYDYDFGTIEGEPELPKAKPDTIERIVLTPKQVDELTDILYNYGFPRRGIGMKDVSGCYDPHQSILWKDAQGEVIHWLEICFHCSSYHTTLPDNAYGDFCEGKYALLKSYFSSLGITKFDEP